MPLKWKNKRENFYGKIKLKKKKMDENTVFKSFSGK